jgi:25S rRNA (uracil2634-N3)-methyltransferase
VEENLKTILASNPKQEQDRPKVLFSVDARKLGTQTGGGKELLRGFTRRERKRPAWFNPSTPDEPYQPGGAWDVICFNFPHVGGLSTDVNRQVRANQELLVAFFKACVPLVSKPPPLMDADEGEYEYEDGEGSDDDEDEEEEEDDGEGEEGEAKDDATTGKGVRTGAGQILVTLFEGEPYTLWNIKDLARHAGLVVVTSFRFPWSSYEGYSHARTVGHIEGKDGERAGWKGEDREARMYVFEVKPKEKKSGKKRNRDDSSDSE